MTYYAIFPRLFQPGGWEGLGVGKIRTLGGISRGLHVRHAGSVNVSEQNRKNKICFKESAHMIVGVGKCVICRQAGRSETQGGNRA